MSWIVSVVLNTVVGLIAYAKSSDSGLLACIVGECVLNLIAVPVMNKFSTKPFISPETKPEEDYKGEFTFAIITSSVVKGTIHYLVLNHLNMIGDGGFNPFYFLVKGLCFETVFDLVHYGLHRGAHAVPAIYQLVHKKHHKFKHPTTETAFYLTPQDLALTYGIPLLIGIYIIPFNRYEFALTTVYLTYQEIAGHLGKRMYPTSSFAMCIWLPRWLGIELYTEDHDLHHSENNCNYSKRFKMWDELFGTYKSGVSNKIFYLCKQ